MFAEKIKLTDAYLDLIIQKRKEHSFTAYQLSEHIGKNKSWLPNIENRRTKNITKEEFLLIFQDFAKNENIDTETYIIKYLPPNALIELEDNTCVPCYYLKAKLNLSPQETAFAELTHPSSELSQLNQSLSDFTQTIQQIFFTLSDQEKQTLLDMLPTMTQNLCCHFPITYSLYRLSLFRNPLPLCDNDNPESHTPLISDKNSNHINSNIKLAKWNFWKPLISDKNSSHINLNNAPPSNTLSENKEKEHQYSKTPFLEDISNLIENFSIILSLINAKANIYRFFDPNFSNETLSYKIEHYQYGNLQELTEILFDIETYSYAIYNYTTLFYKDTNIKKEEYTLNYQELYQILLQFIKDFLCIAELSYPFEFQLPHIHPTKEELEKKHLETTNILFQIRNLFYTEYNSSTKNNKKIPFLPESSEPYLDYSDKFNKTKIQKTQKEQKFQKEPLFSEHNKENESNNQRESDPIKSKQDNIKHKIKEKEKHKIKEKNKEKIKEKEKPKIL